jgi:hypothetical protein
MNIADDNEHAKSPAATILNIGYYSRMPATKAGISNHPIITPFHHEKPCLFEPN